MVNTNTFANWGYVEGVKPLYNGNISATSIHIPSLSDPQMYLYGYDQLNRLSAMSMVNKPANGMVMGSGNNWSYPDYKKDFKESISYDANGNIMSYNRNGNTAGGKPLGMDSLTYHYIPGTNKLDYISDAVSRNNYAEDIDNQNPHNYTYDLSPVDAVDNLAKSHDIGYDKLSAVGGSGLFDDWGTTPVDEAALNGWNNFLANSKVGSADPYNGQAVTKSERSAAKNASILFDFVVADKKGSISSWMQRNYKGEAANHSNKGMYGKKDMEANYGLFLNKYMQEGTDGNWTRKEDMWSKDKKGNWTPNKPK